MSLRRVALAMLGLVVALSPILMLRVAQELEILRNAEAYRRATFIVTGSSCAGGHSYRDRRSGRTSHDREHCFLEGRVDGVAPLDGGAERLAVGRSATEEHGAGSEIPVWYAAELPAFGADTQNLRFQFDFGEHPRVPARRQLWAWPIGLGFVLLWIVGLEALYGWTPHAVRGARQARMWIVPNEGLAPAFGFAFGGFGLFIVQSDLRGASSEGVWIIGLVLLCIGLPFFVRPLFELDREGATLRRRLAFGPLSLGLKRRPIEAPQLEVVGPNLDEAEPGVSLTTRAARISLYRDADAARVRAVASEISGHLGCGLRDRLAEAEARAAEQGPGELEPPEPRRPWLASVMQTLSLVGLPLVVIASVPALRDPLLIRVLSRDVPQVEPLQRFAAQGLAGGDSVDGVRSLLYAANTTEGAVRAAAIEALEASAGLEPGSGALGERVRRLNAWAAERLGETTDPGGGVLGWFEVQEIWRDEVEAIASADPREAWVTWSGFGTADFPDSRAFLRAVGPALGDARPLSFAIKRGSFLQGAGPDAPPFEGQPEPLGDHASEALVDTVGGALALRYWNFADVASDDFPADFDAWWARHAREHLLPQLPISTSAPARHRP